MLNIISLGAGVQSSTMALMAAHGEIEPMPDAAIFADTGAEPERIYEYLEFLRGQLPFPVYTVMHKEGLKLNIIKSIKGARFAGAPFYCETDGTREGMLRRQCTREFKIQPIHLKMRELAGLKKGERSKGVVVTSWHGISRDEIQRARLSTDKWMQIRYPLLELEKHRHHCLEWMAAHDYPRPTKSACTFCPYTNDASWRNLKQLDPTSFNDAVAMDEVVRKGVKGVTSKLYVHSSCKPLASIDFSNAEDHGQVDAFADECEGMCGL